MKFFSFNCCSSGYFPPEFSVFSFPAQYTWFHFVFLIWERPTNIRSLSRKDEWIFVHLHFQCIVFLPIDTLLIFREEKESNPYVNKLPLAAVLGTFHQEMLAVIPCQENTSTFNRLTQRWFFFFLLWCSFLKFRRIVSFKKQGKKLPN